jgi:hypothetical protein
MLQFYKADPIGQYSKTIWPEHVFLLSACIPNLSRPLTRLTTLNFSLPCDLSNQTVCLPHGSIDRTFVLPCETH